MSRDDYDVVEVVDRGAKAYNDVPEERDRVRIKLAPAILAYCLAYRQIPFHDFDLLAYLVHLGFQLAPGSCSRILRDLRQRGLIKYTVIDRPQSLYLVTWVGLNAEDDDDG